VAKVDTEVPDIFPETHNRNLGQKVLDRFESVSNVLNSAYTPPPLTSKVCNEANFVPVDYDCNLFWCEAYQDLTPQGSCMCYQKSSQNEKTNPALACGTTSSATVQTRVVGTAAIPAPITSSSVKWPNTRFEYLKDPKINGPPMKLADIAVHDWELGHLKYHIMTEINTTWVRTIAAASPCHVDELCFCGAQVCKPSAGWHSGRSFVWPEPQTRRLGQQQLKQFAVPLGSQATVDVVFGLHLTGRVPVLGTQPQDEMWSFRTEFDIRNPWAQRNLYKLCTKPPVDLRVVLDKTACWLKDFRDFQEAQKLRFPVLQHQFKERVDLFRAHSITKQSASSDYMWLRNGIIRACYMNFVVDVHKNSKAEDIKPYKERWDMYITTFNRAASPSAVGAFHTSDLWVQAAAQAELVSSTLLTLILVLVFAFMGMLAFTLDPVLSLFVVATTIGVIVSLAFFIIVIMGWPIGPIEAISLIVFIGYAVTYSLHIAHKYACTEGIGSQHAEFLEEPCPDEWPLHQDTATTKRYQRTLYAMKSIAGATVGSAVTTIGSSFFLLFCSILLFKKLGGVVISVTLLSVYAGLITLPAMLLMAGPLHPGSQCYRLLNFAFSRLCGRTSLGQSLAFLHKDKRALPAIGSVEHSPRSAQGSRREEPFMLSISDDIAEVNRNAE
jgi:hypothetical protein